MRFPLPKMKANKEAYELQRDCKHKISDIQKMAQQLKRLEVRMQDINEQNVKNTQVLQVPISCLSPCLCHYFIYVILLGFTIFFVSVPSRFVLFEDFFSSNLLNCLRKTRSELNYIEINYSQFKPNTNTRIPKFRDICVLVKNRKEEVFWMCLKHSCFLNVVA